MSPPGMSAGLPGDVEALRAGLDATGYLADDDLATALFLAVRMGQPILLEGEPGVGKTQAAKALAEVLDTPLLRLQCYEGITAAEALYEWNYPRQLLSIRLAESRHTELSDADLFTPAHLLARPLLAAIEHPGPRPAVLLIDEIDRADDEFEAFLLELLAESAVTIPELGTRHATVPPIAVLTSNRTRDLHDALKRRCLYHWIAHPGPDRVAEIVRRRVPEAGGWLAARVAGSVQRIRGLELLKPPGVAEAISWTNALHVLGVDGDGATSGPARPPGAESGAPEPAGPKRDGSAWAGPVHDGPDGSGAERVLLAAAERTLGTVLKYDEDVQVVRAAGLANLLAAP